MYETQKPPSIQTAMGAVFRIAFDRLDRVITAWLSNQCELGALIAYSLFMAGILVFARHYLGLSDWIGFEACEDDLSKERIPALIQQENWTQHSNNWPIQPTGSIIKGISCRAPGSLPSGHMPSFDQADSLIFDLCNGRQVRTDCHEKETLSLLQKLERYCPMRVSTSLKEDSLPITRARDSKEETHPHTNKDGFPISGERIFNGFFFLRIDQ